jgi:succinyl-CoA synthetase alpha subunit
MNAKQKTHLHNMGYLFHKAFENAGVKVAEKPSDVTELLAKALEM